MLTIAPAAHHPHLTWIESPFGRGAAGAPRGSAFGAAPQLDRRPWLMGRQVESLPEILPQAKRGKNRRVTVIGEDVLHRELQLVTEFGTDELKHLIDDMFTSMLIAQGVGLAANQIGVDLKVFVYDCPDANNVRHVGHCINPVIDEDVKAKAKLVSDTEGCLSVPGGSATVARAGHAVCHGFDVNGNPLTLEGTGTFARCLQHETDHLNGVLYVDHLTKRARVSALAEMEEVKREIWAEWEQRAAAYGKEHHPQPTA